jgi:isopentenyl diphosphate isomerase/L-lactate dehydrogenase-like FMN-dependent dehydrogenase
MQPVNLSDYEALAKARLDRGALDYYQGGSDDEVTLRANRTAFERLRLRPRVLVDVSACDLRTSVIDIPVSMPILVAPTAAHALAHPDAECATAQAAGAAGTLMVVSSSATRSLEDVARAAPGPLWFQLYIRRLRHAEALVVRAQAAGYRALVLTVDTPRLGNRERDIRNNFEGFPTPNYDSDGKEEPFMGDTLTWDILDWLRSLTSLPILLKGILTAEDALLAVERGVAGIIVSNHGGRQLDGAVPSIEALPEVIAAVDGRSEVYLDGGIRRGTDVLKALALGARAVLIGRPILWGLAVDGAAGARRVLEILRAELEKAMILAGRPTLASIDRTLVQPVGTASER